MLGTAARSDHNAGLHEGLVDLADGVDEASITEGKVLLDSHLPVLLGGGAHDFLETRVDDIDLVSALELRSLVLEAHKLEELSLRLLLVFLGHTAGGDVVQVLQPFEVGAGDTTTVDKHVRGAHNALALEDLLGGVGRGTVGTLEDGLHSDGVGVTLVEGLLGGGGDHAVSLLEEELLGVLADGLSGVREGGEGTVLGHPCLHGLNIETVRVVDGGVVLDDGGDLATILLDELGGPVADSTEALHDEGLVLDAEAKAAAVDEALGVEELTDGVVDTETSGLGSAGNATLGDELASAAALSVDVLLALDVHVGVLDPGHGLLVGSHVGSEAINLGTDEALLDQLHSVLTGDTLDLGLRVLAGVNLDTTLGAAEGDVSDGELEGHEGGQSLDLLEIDVVRVTGTALHGELVGGVLGSTTKEQALARCILNQLKLKIESKVAWHDRTTLSCEMPVDSLARFCIRLRQLGARLTCSR